MASFYKHQGKTLYDVFNEIQEKLGYHIESQYSYAAAGIEGVEKIKQLMTLFRTSNFKYIADEKVVISEDYLSLIKKENGQETHLDYEKSNVLRYIFEDGSFVAIRPSGTEPKVKFYFALCGKDNNEALLRHDKVKNFILSLINK